MKRQFYFCGLMLAATFTLTNCSKEMNQSDDSQPAGIPFEIVASTADTKTTNDGLKTNWADGDAINLFHIESGSTSSGYVSNGSFAVADAETGVFTGELTAGLTAESYDWYALYPYSDYLASPNSTEGYIFIGHRTNLVQNGYGSTSHLSGSSCPLYGVVKGVAASQRPEMTMNHLTSVVAINVTNNTDEPLTVTTASITAQEDIVGSYYIDYTGDQIVYNSKADAVSATASVSVTEGTALENGASAVVYIVIKPFTAKADTDLTVSVNGYSKTITLANDVTFSAGKIKTLNFSYDAVPVVKTVSLPWNEDFSTSDLSNYTITNGSVTTKLYEENLAGGTAPELLISKTGGQMTTNVSLDGYVGNLTLSFACNYPDRITVSSSTEGVEIVANSTTEYIISVPEGADVLQLSFTNSTSSNARIDDIALLKGVVVAQELSFSIPGYYIVLGSEEYAAYSGQVVDGAKTEVTYMSDNEDVAIVDASTGTVTLGEVAGTATITATAVATTDYKSATASYTITLAEPSSDDTKTYTLTIDVDDFNSTSYAANNTEKTSQAIALDGSGTLDVNWTSYQVMYQNSAMQWQKNKGYIYNNTYLGKITNIEITSTAGTFTTYINDTQQPIENGEGGYFQIKVGSATGKASKVVITFEY